MRSLIKHIVILINSIAGICLLISYTANYISPSNFWTPALFGLAYPYIMLLNILFMLFWFFFDAKYSLISFFCILIGYGYLKSYVQISKETTNEKGLLLCSYNVKYFVGEGVRPHLSNAEKVIEYLDKEKFDIICLQEANLSSQRFYSIDKLKDKLTNISHMQLAHTSQIGGPVTYTKYPIVNMGEIRYEKSGNMVIFTDIAIDSDTVRIYNCHLQSYRIKPTEIDAIDSLSFNNNPGRYKDVRNVGFKLKQAFKQRAEQASRLQRHIQQSPYPVIVCGDFNDTPISYAYHKVRGELKDAFIESGHGIGNTYNGKLPSFRIDYILHDKHFNSFDFDVEPLPYSDHFPIRCKIVLPTK